jgi:hypothetical protein
MTRTFDFPAHSGEPWEYLATIRAALEDEGLRLADAQGFRIKAVLRDDPGLGRIERVSIPQSMILEVKP